MESRGEVILEERKVESIVTHQNKNGDPIDVCWARLDDKMKMVNFNVRVMDYNSGEQASMHDLEIIAGEMHSIEAAIDVASKNTFEKKALDTIFSESNMQFIFILDRNTFIQQQINLAQSI